MPARIRMTEAKVKTLPPGLHRDDKVRGLFVMVGPQGSSYKIQSSFYGYGKPVSIRMTLGRITDYSLDEARKWADDKLGMIRRGEDPRYETKVEPWTVRQMYDEFLASRAQERRDPVHSANIRTNRDRHLAKWLAMPMSVITHDMVRARHREIGESAPVTANHTFKQFRAAWNHAIEARGEHNVPPNPALGLKWFRPKPIEREEDEQDKALLPSELPVWWQAVQALDNPLRRNLHVMALLTGIRYGHLTGIRREWVHLDEARIWFPKMKRQKPVDLPLSDYLAALVAETERLSEAMYPGNPYLFPTVAARGSKVYGHKKGAIVPIQDWREDTLATGHRLRHTYISFADKLSIPLTHRMMLVDHAVSGMHGHYANRKIKFPELLSAQSEITRLLLGACGAL